MWHTHLSQMTLACTFSHFIAKFPNVRLFIQRHALYVQANSAGASGDFDNARSQNNISIGCSIAGAVSTVVGIGVIVGVVYGIALSG